MHAFHQAVPSQRELLLDREVAGFKLTRSVAHSAIASVFEGVRGTTRAAVKIYMPSWAARSERNEREEQAQRQIAHPCIARALETERCTDGSFVLVSEWIEGGTLEARLAQGRLPWPAVVAILRDVARGLGAIHAAKVIHRDLKPSNIMLPASGTPSAIIVDFGHALAIDDARLTGTGLVLGSAHYMAPEQAKGGPIDPRTDLYAVGVVLYRMLTGTLPFDHASPAEVMRMHQQEPVPLPRTRASVLPAAEDLCLWLLAKNPAQRLPNAHVLRLTLEALERSAAASTENSR
jgi:eukaryotic-like serine/threonine-protein kinase